MAKQMLNKETFKVERHAFTTVIDAVVEGIISSGVKAVYNYPGRPATYLIDKLKEKKEKKEKSKIDIDIQDYLPNEYVAAGKGFGSSVAGCERSLVVFKDVGANVACDHFYCLNHIGINRGLVFFIADDPSAWHSQNEEDSRGIYFNAGLPILEPFDANSAYYCTKIAYELSEITRLPFFIRTTARALTETFASNDDLKNVTIPFAKDFVDIPFDAKNRWLSIFSTVEEDKEELYQKHEELAKYFDESNLNVVKGKGRLGVIASGFIATQLENEKLIDNSLSLLKLATVFPLPENQLLGFIEGKEKILVIDQGEPLLEMLIRDIVHRNGWNIPVYGKLDGFVRRVGEFRDNDLKLSIDALKSNIKPKKFPKHKKIAKAPAFEKDSPYRILVETLRDAVKEAGVRPLYVADAGQSSRIPDTPDLEDLLHLETTMGGVISYLSGGIEAYKRIGKEAPFKGIAYVGDSDLLHSAFPGVCEAATKDHPILMILTDNQGAVSTGGQPHLGMKFDDNMKIISFK
ncbi:MAG: hypothetical protein HYR97_06150, partial [Candidatus Melainabacteria bacterium]|nr:hypothetical protein [Candidatus Melainabacteria bacterium]